ncbi:GNAT family N-acetyltransferase [Neobacillus vireti]|uniref:N-acetyltransferase domain-containing protein n=1 Tax=Neobacillus vireti LMG 21834 TaxID=1131730 RepID=A0AB94IUL7_9BACI|nr:GNAT family N-acetyltransferase [Neobacillus vireti]ETI70799.1 hypothetical protein BAVI_00330 [Neobacillus vireti LMG 21834]KLT17660.1 acetyltransferase [Neobacillus vireti]
MLRIGTAELKDLAGILEIDKIVIGNDSRKGYLREAINGKKCLAAKTEFSVVGYLIFNTHFFDCSFISLVIVHPSKRKKGYAKLMIEHFETISPTPKIFSSTNQSNEIMQSLFDSIGYVKSGFVENLDEGDPEIIYFKKVKQNNGAFINK